MKDFEYLITIFKVRRQYWERLAAHGDEQARGRVDAYTDAIREIESLIGVQ